MSQKHVMDFENPIEAFLFIFRVVDWVHAQWYVSSGWWAQDLTVDGLQFYGSFNNLECFCGQRIVFVDCGALL